ncbi:MAG: hypothetical protein C0179_02435 [Fervidicoccus sp.]|nr:MAG: hypothetical protein C0179_02435 [Fervidicoccus sp.]
MSSEEVKVSGKGVIKRIARQRGVPVSLVKSEFMKNVAEAAKMVLKEKFKGNKFYWIPALKAVLKPAFALLRSRGAVPSPAEIYEAAKSHIEEVAEKVEKA